MTPCTSYKESLIPELSRLESGLHLFARKRVIGHAQNFGDTASFFNQKQRFQFNRIQEIGGVRGNENLAATVGISLKLLCEQRHQLRVKLIFRLFNAKNFVRHRVVQQHHVGKHLDGAVRHIVVQKRVAECPVRIANEQTAVIADFRLDVFNPRHAPAHFFQDVLKHRAFLFPQPERDRRQVVPGTGKMDAALLHFLAAGIHDVEVRYMPVGNQVVERPGRLEIPDGDFFNVHLSVSCRRRSGR